MAAVASHPPCVFSNFLDLKKKWFGKFFLSVAISLVSWAFVDVICDKFILFDHTRPFLPEHPPPSPHLLLSLDDDCICVHSRISFLLLTGTDRADAWGLVKQDLLL